MTRSKGIRFEPDELAAALAVVQVEICRLANVSGDQKADQAKRTKAMEINGILLRVFNKLHQAADFQP